MESNGVTIARVSGDFVDFFRRATTYTPYPYQVRLARSRGLPKLLAVPTGAGKTEAAILAAWLWRRLHHPNEVVRRGTPRRLVYCLPMRTLVEQTGERVQRWLHRLGLSGQLPLTILMGGEELDDWHLYPEQMRVIIGTQDMLLSRALNRGYAASPFRWPWEFGLLNSDCLWALDEVQLLANGLSTSTQVQAFRGTLGAYGTCHTLWMSATVFPEWLQTVDAPPPTQDEVCRLGPDDLAHADLAQRLHAPKALHRLELQVKGSGYGSRNLAQAVLKSHQIGTVTLVVVNTVRRAQVLFSELHKLKPEADLVLVHSRFRSADRKDKNEGATSPVDRGGRGRIVVATQAIEAGVDMSAHTLVTELAPWSSLVQRFGRCNRRGEYSDASIYWLDLQDKDAAPYDAEALSAARKCLQQLEGQSVAPANLKDPVGLPQIVSHKAVLRKRDLMGLFDTAADLSGSYLDVSRFVRGTDEMDVYVFWRAWEGDSPPTEMPAPERDELCSVPVGEMRGFLDVGWVSRRAPEADMANLEEEPEEVAADSGDNDSAVRVTRARRGQAWRWDHLLGQWERVSQREVFSGQTLLINVLDGGYTREHGWDPGSRYPVPPLCPSLDTLAQEAMESESSNAQQRTWVTLRDHSMHVQDETRRILEALSDVGVPADVQKAVLAAALYHDLGKAHRVFQETMLSNLTPQEKAQRQGTTTWAKQGPGSQQGRTGVHSRPYFRHEVASALGLLAANVSLDGSLSDLAAYLVAAHHGKVRLAMRSLPKARNQDPSQYYLLGFVIPEAGVTQEEARRSNTLPATELGNGVIAPELVLDLSTARIGVSNAGERSWLERTLGLLNKLGPFRLAYLEALLRAADVRASKGEQIVGDCRG